MTIFSNGSKTPAPGKPGSVSSVHLTVLGPGTSLTGDLQTDGTVTVEGNVTGTVRSTGTVAVANGGAVTGDIHAAEIVVAGVVEGNLHAKQRAELLPGGRLEGDVFAPRVSIQEGGTLNGRLKTSGKAA